MHNLANHILNVAYKNNLAVTNIHLQKILYFLIRNSKSYLPSELITKTYDEPFLVWQYGPVIESIYNQYLTYGTNAILESGQYNDQFKTLDSEIIRYLNTDVFRMINASKTHRFWKENLRYIKNGRSYVYYPLEKVLI